MKKKIKDLKDREIDHICNKQTDCEQCPFFVFIDEDNIVGICTTALCVVGREGLLRVVDNLEKEIDIEETES